MGFRLTHGLRLIPVSQRACFSEDPSLLYEPVKVRLLHEYGVAYLMVAELAALAQVVNKVTLDPKVAHAVPGSEPDALHLYDLRPLHSQPFATTRKERGPTISVLLLLAVLAFIQPDSPRSVNTSRFPTLECGISSAF